MTKSFFFNIILAPFLLWHYDRMFLKDQNTQNILKKIKITMGYNLKTVLVKYITFKECYCAIVTKKSHHFDVMKKHFHPFWAFGWNVLKH